MYLIHKEKKSSVSVKLSLRFMLILSGEAILIPCVCFFLINRFFLSDKNRELIDCSNKICRTIEMYQSPDERHDTPYYISYMVFDSKSGAVYSTNDPFLPALPVTEKKARYYFQKSYYSDGDLNILYYSKIIQVNMSEVTVQVSTDMTQNIISRFAPLFIKTIISVLFPLLVISYLICLYITKKTMSPVVRMTEAAKAISSENMGKLLPSGPDNNELDQLAQTFNNLFKKLKNDFDRERSFTSNVSHELKTPVAVITGEARLLKRWGKDDKKQLEYSLDTIIKEGKSMEKIINSLLNMSKLEAGLIKCSKQPVSISESLERIKNEFLIVYPDVSFEIHIKEQNDIIETDPELFHQLLSIITSNSIKFAGSRCTVIFEQEKDTDGNLHLLISDNGPGFCEQSLPHVFERFWRGDEAHTRSAGGAGLGLSIAKTICTVLGSEIKALNSNKGGALIKISF